jgi:hypothetical protein
MNPFARRIARILAPLALLGGTAAFALPATHAGLLPTLEITALHQSVVVDGLEFATNNQPVILDAYLIENGQKTFIGSAERTPTAQTSNTFVWDFVQAQDPCTTAATPQIEVDAYLAQPLLQRRALMVQAPGGHLQFPPVVTGPEIATNTVNEECGVIIF